MVTTFFQELTTDITTDQLKVNQLHKALTNKLNTGPHIHDYSSKYHLIAWEAPDLSIQSDKSQLLSDLTPCTILKYFNL